VPQSHGGGAGGKVLLSQREPKRGFDMGMACGGGGAGPLEAPRRAGRVRGTPGCRRPALVLITGSRLCPVGEARAPDQMSPSRRSPRRRPAWAGRAAAAVSSGGPLSAAALREVTQLNTAFSPFIWLVQANRVWLVEK